MTSPTPSEAAVRALAYAMEHNLSGPVPMDIEAHRVVKTLAERGFAILPIPQVGEEAVERAGYGASLAFRLQCRLDADRPQPLIAIGEGFARELIHALAIVHPQPKAQEQVDYLAPEAVERAARAYAEVRGRWNKERLGYPASPEAFPKFHQEAMRAALSTLSPSPGAGWLPIMQALADAADEINGSIDRQTYDAHAERQDDDELEVRLSVKDAARMNTAICAAQQFVRTNVPLPAPPAEPVGEAG